MDEPGQAGGGCDDVVERHLVVERLIGGRSRHAGEYGIRYPARWTSGRALRSDGAEPQQAALACLRKH